MKFAFVCVAAAAVRKKPEHRSEMVNQLLFGEAVEVMRQKDSRWVKIRSLHDNYQGWITIAHLHGSNKSQAFAAVEYVTTDYSSGIAFSNSLINVSPGSSLPGFDIDRGKMGTLNYSCNGNVLRLPEHPVAFDAEASWLHAWLEVPYLWGGRTPLGIDCSGLIQLIYRRLGVSLPRDAWQQQERGIKIKGTENAVAGDLFFFQDTEKRIVHVAIYLGESRLMHASGKVRIDRIGKKRIIFADSKEKGWELHSIRRVLQ